MKLLHYYLLPIILDGFLFGLEGVTGRHSVVTQAGMMALIWPATPIKSARIQLLVYFRL